MNNKAVVFGKFGLVHHGHLSLLEYARSISTELVVCVINDPVEPRTNEEIQRSVNLVSRLNIADEVVFVENIEKYLKNYTPDFVVKGQEFKGVFNVEQEIVSSYGGRLVFSDHRTELQFSKSHTRQHQGEVLNRIEIDEFITNHSLDLLVIEAAIMMEQNHSFAVVGDLIVDRYIDTKPLGLSQEEPAIVVTPESEKVFLGGAAVVASLAAEFNVETSFFSLVGGEKDDSDIEASLMSRGIDTHFLHDFDSQTVTKLKYFIQGSPQIRVNRFSATPPSLDYEERLEREILVHAEGCSCIIFSDFNYGAIPSSKIEKLITFFKKQNAIVAADSQSSSQIGRIGMFFSADLVCLTEHEARLELKDFESNLNILLQRICEQVKSSYVLLKLGSRGLMAAERVSENWEVFSMDALNTDPIDVSGAGDTMLVTICIGLTRGLSFKEAVLLANIAAGLQVSVVGHGGLSKEKILDWVRK